MAAALLQLPTLSMSPVVWQDEVQTIEYGRQLFDGATDASVVLESGLRPAGSLNYLGSWLQEAMFRLAGGSYLAPRLVNLLAATAAALLAAAWLKNRGVIAPAASLAALLFFIDPCFERSYRGGRIEGLVFLVVMAFCWLLSQPSGKSRWHPWLAGALAGVIPW
ncbi:MAG: hypothetical protein JNG86_15635, partial [Verrucomicrobiaceae bacterium]|nr:hypothetical protein [Verrucomicrobiaceae bacterium]